MMIKVLSLGEAVAGEAPSRALRDLTSVADDIVDCRAQMLRKRAGGTQVLLKLRTRKTKQDFLSLYSVQWCHATKKRPTQT